MASRHVDSPQTLQQLQLIGGQGDFKTTEASRPPFNAAVQGLTFTQTPAPEWKPGSGANDKSWKDHETISIDPYGPGRSSIDNYKLLISGIIPRPIGFISTVAQDGTSTNLAPMSYTNVMNHDPPIFAVGLSGGKGHPKDTCRNLLESGECTINIISEWFVEAANYTAINSPFGTSEWGMSGLTPAESKVVKAPRVAESAFSIEGKVVGHHEWTSPGTGQKTGVTFLIQGVHFHVRDDALNEARNMIDPSVLQPVSRLGGVTYGRTTEGYELPRPDFGSEQERPEVQQVLNEDPKGQRALEIGKKG